MVSSMNRASSRWHSGGVLEPSWVPASNKLQRINAYHTLSCTRTTAADIAAPNWFFTVSIHEVCCQGEKGNHAFYVACVTFETLPPPLKKHGRPPAPKLMKPSPSCVDWFPGRRIWPHQVGLVGCGDAELCWEAAGCPWFAQPVQDQMEPLTSSTIFFSWRLCSSLQRLLIQRKLMVAICISLSLGLKISWVKQWLGKLLRLQILTAGESGSPVCGLRVPSCSHVFGGRNPTHQVRRVEVLGCWFLELQYFFSKEGGEKKRHDIIPNVSKKGDV